jgi:alpha-L-glutamate ligase-like protein
MGMYLMWQNRRRVLGINERNLSYIKPYNPPRAKKVADDKLRTKKVLAKNDVPTPKLIGVIKDYRELSTFDWDQLPKSFVIKPVRGLEGGGIEIFFNRDNEGNWIKGDGSRHSLSDIQGLAAEIIDGKFSLHGQPDQVFFEERIRMHKTFKYYAYKGVPDVRVISFNSIPVIGMLRLPTKESEGKGNLAMGAVGAGIDIATGVTTNAIIGKSKMIEKIPGTKLNVSGLRIPYWEKILYYSIAAQRAAGLRFAAIDFLIDRDQGPMIVELNARPGLSIQLANRDGLRWRLRKARGIKVQSIEKGVRLAKDLFGGYIEEDIERISGKYLIGIYETVVLHSIDGNNKEVKTKAKIDTGADSTSIDSELASKLGYEEYIESFEEIKRKLGIGDQFSSLSEAKEQVALLNEEIEKSEFDIDLRCDWVRSSHGISIRLYAEIELTLGDLKYKTMANIYDRSKLTYKIIVGRKSLSRFLVEPAKK